MAFGTRVNVELYFSHKTYNDKYEVEEDLKDTQENLHDIETRIAMYAASSPREGLHTKDCEGEDMNPVDVLYYELKRLKEWYKEEVLKEWQLEMLLDNWDARTGDFIDQDKLRDELMNK